MELATGAAVVLADGVGTDGRRLGRRGSGTAVRAAPGKLERAPPQAKCGVGKLVEDVHCILM